MLTNKKAKVIGFYGIDIYDIILYSASLIANMGKSILLIDNSEHKALSYCIKTPSQVNLKENIIHDRGIDFIIENSYLKFIYEYEYIFVDYGFTTFSQEIYHSDKIIYITDVQLHNIDRIIKFDKLTMEDNTYLVIRDVFKKDNFKYIIELFIDNGLVIDGYSTLNDGYLEKRMRASIQFGKRLQYKSLSYMIQSLVEKILTDILDISKEQYSVAYRRMKRGA
ncbi:MAG TPA: hypothetical protein GXZ90_08695 [Clostridiales bacterium]|nr:hypothetical protein [Clostridiales bacterium]